MARPRPILASSILLALVGCGDDGGSNPGPDAQETFEPTANLGRDLDDTALTIDLAAHTGVEEVSLAAADAPGATFEIGDLTIQSVERQRGVTWEAIPFAAVGGEKRLHLGIGPDAARVRITYGWTFHEQSDGVDMNGFTLTWPYFCGNVFPCHSDPTDGTSFTLAVTNPPAGQTAVYPAAIPGDAPSYMAAWAVGNYQRTELGQTTAGTTVVFWATPGADQTAATTGTRHLVAAFDWMEQHLGPYLFGSEAGSVSAHWGRNAYGGMEHHPLWHVSDNAIGDESVHVHEAAHGWFGDGIRLKCWEDFTLSEGAATYYEARVVEEVGDPGDGAAAWAALDSELEGLRSSGGGSTARPAGCGVVDVLDIFTRTPYVKGGLWLRAVERKITRPMFDAAMHTFYMRYAGKPAGIDDLVAVFREVSGYDATACTAAWLGQQTIPTDLACP